MLDTAIANKISIDNLVWLSICSGTLYFNNIFQNQHNGCFIQESGVEEVPKFSTAITFCKQKAHYVGPLR